MYCNIDLSWKVKVQLQPNMDHTVDLWIDALDTLDCK